MAEVNKNSLLSDFFQDIGTIQSFVSDFAPRDKYNNIQQNYTNYNVEELQNAIKALDTDLANFDQAGTLSQQLKNQYYALSGQMFEKDGGVNEQTYPNLIDASTTATASDFAKVDTTNITQGNTDINKYYTGDQYSQNVYNEEVADTETTISKEEFDEKYTNAPFKMPSAIQEKIDEANIVNQRDDQIKIIAEKGFEDLKASEGQLTAEQKKQRVSDLTEELKAAIGFDDKVDPNLLLMKFGVDVLNARSDKRKPLPRMLDIFAQALAPTTEFLINQKGQKQQDLKEIGLTAFSLVKEEDDDRKRMFEPTDNLTSIQTLQYNEDGKLTGELEFFKNTMTNAEANFYSNIKYPEKIGGVPTPENLVGKPIFTVTAPGLATDRPATSGLLGDNDSAVSEMLEQANFLEQGIQGELTILDIGRLNEQAGKKIFGPTYNLSLFTSTATGILSDLSNYAKNYLGFELDTSKFTDDMTVLDKEVEAAKQLGINVSPEALLDDVNSSYKKTIQEINASNMAQEDKNDAISQLSGFYSEFQNDVLTKNLNLLKIIEAQRTFSFARYLQGSNRLLKDVIADSRSVVKVGGLGNYHDKVVDRAEGMLNFYIRNYNDMIRPFYNDEDYEKYKKTLVIDKKTGRYTVVGGVYQKEQVSDAFGSVEAGKINNMSTMDMIEDKMGEGFLQEYNILP